jgi:hypothetical protein
MTRAFCALATIAGVLGAAACSSGSDSRPPSDEPGVKSDAGSTSSGGSSGASSSGASSSGASSSGASSSGAGDDEGGDDAAPTDASASDVYVSQATEAGMTDPSCSPNQTWSAGTAVPGVAPIASNAAPLLAMTSDELTMAWVVDAGGGAGTVFVADRTSSTAAFGAAAMLTPAMGGGTAHGDDGGTIVLDAGSGYFSFDRVALSANGLTLIGVAVGQLHLAQFTRAARGLAFGTAPMEGNFSAIAGSLMAGERLGDPVLSADGDDFVYSKYGNSPTLSVYESIKSAGTGFASGTGQAAAALAFSGSVRKVPTSMTADRRVLFVWDGAANKAYGVLRGGNTGQYNFAIDVGARFSAQVNGDCTRIYYVAQTGGSYTLEVSSSQ